jgi:hypothetical protein
VFASRQLIDKALLEWFQSIRSNKVICNGPVLIEKAYQFAVSFGLPATCDHNYIYRWRIRYNIIWKAKLYGEAGDVNQDTFQ